MKRYDIINKLIEANKYSSYLEIGTQHGETFSKINIKDKECIDPIKKFENLTYEMTSDEFFTKNEKKYDIIFVDGLHTEEQTTRDIHNALSCLNTGGVIVAHDCLPHNEDYTRLNWSGTVYRSIVELRVTRPDLYVYVVETDCGCGVISRGTQKIYDKVDLSTAKTYTYYDKYKKELMNSVSIDWFLSNIET